MTTIDGNKTLASKHFFYSTRFPLRLCCNRLGLLKSKRTQACAFLVATLEVLYRVWFSPSAYLIRSCGKQTPLHFILQFNQALLQIWVKKPHFVKVRKKLVKLLKLSAPNNALGVLVLK